MMNRLSSQPDLHDDILSASIPSVAAAVCTESGDVCRHSLFAPLHYERNYGYPLLVWLHSPGNDERQLRRIMPHLSMRNYVAVAPRGTLEIDADSDVDGYRWAQQGDHIFLAEQLVFDCVELARRKFNVKRERIFLAGAGCGGTMAVRLALTNPAAFAGALSIGGELPRGMAPLARLNQARALPLLLIAGLESERYSQPRVNEDLRLLHSAGIAVSLRLYPFGDEIAPLMLADVDRWLMQQICPESASSD
jgi:phospholipase/carboxylesterase